MNGEKEEGMREGRKESWDSIGGQWEGDMCKLGEGRWNEGRKRGKRRNT